MKTTSEEPNAVHAAETVQEEKPDEAKDSENKEPEELKGVFVVRDGKARFVKVETGVADQKKHYGNHRDRSRWTP